MFAKEIPNVFTWLPFKYIILFYFGLLSEYSCFHKCFKCITFMRDGWGNQRCTKTSHLCHTVMSYWPQLITDGRNNTNVNRNHLPK